MTQMSPSLDKVDDFLSQLSQLSQERLSEDQNRQQALERNIQSLRSSSSSPHKRLDSFTPSKPAYTDVPSLKFNRDKRLGNTPPPKPQRPKPNLQESRDESPPPLLPRRREETPPALPRRRDASEDEQTPPLPQRRYLKTPPQKPSQKPGDFTIDLVKPVSAPTAHKIKPLASRGSSNQREVSDSQEKRFRSFAEVENSIKGEPAKPAKPSKSDGLSSSISPSSATSGVVDAVAASQNSKPLGEKPVIAAKFVPQTDEVEVVSPTRGIRSTSWIDSAQSRSPIRNRSPVTPITMKPKPQVKPKVEANLETKATPKPVIIKPKPIVETFTKPSYDNYKSKDNEPLLSQLAKMKDKPKPVPKPKPADLAKYDENTTTELKTQLTKLASNKTSSQPIKPIKPSVMKYKEQDTSLLNSQISRLGKRTALESAPVDFKSQLNSIIRVTTAPQLGGPPATKLHQLERSQSFPIEKRPDTESTSKLTHPQKSRAKGPKRRLPKNLNRGTSMPSSAEAKKFPPPTNKDSTLETKKASTPETKKVPPPINKASKPKPKTQPVEDVKTSLQFKGEITEKVNDVIAVIPPKLEQLQQYFKHHFVQDVESYIDEFKSLDSDQVLESFKQLKVNSVTVTISIVGLTTLFVLGRLLFGGSSATSEEKPKKKKKKTSKAKKANKQIQDLLDNFETTWVPQINDYFNDYKTMKPEDAQYKYKYFQEMLLKELFKLDEVDTLGNPVIRENRKKVIQFIQDHQKRLDAFKKEVDL
ncbi:hypothetical protein PSN45_004539 [Yamadazyma tenuis]|uniref:uncharacterized protein n=1 Tax=Candida tenuis TaxID=2315449 RepID=UPI00279B412B|nr:hypothetical protein PSN45_004539 [Yamadazyma tenuis]